MCFGNKFTGPRCSCKGGALTEYKIIEKLIGNVLSWRFYAGGALKEVADSAGLTVPTMHKSGKDDTSAKTNQTATKKYALSYFSCLIHLCKPRF